MKRKIICFVLVGFVCSMLFAAPSSHKCPLCWGQMHWTGETEIRDFLQGRMTPAEIESCISFLNKNGNIILYFYYKYDSSKLGWCYFEKR